MKATPHDGQRGTYRPRSLHVPAALASRADVTPAAKLIFAALAGRIGPNGECWPGQRRLAADCGLGLKVVNRAVRELVDASLVVVIRGGLDGPRAARTNRYQLCDCPRNVPKKGTSASRRRHGRNVVETATFPKGQRSPFGNSDVPFSGTEVLKGKSNTLSPTPLSRREAAGTTPAADAIPEGVTTSPPRPAPVAAPARSPAAMGDLFMGDTEAGGTVTGRVTASELDRLAEGLYGAYPRKVGREAALKAARAAILRVAERDGCDRATAAAWLMERVTTFAASPAGRAGKYTPHPSTWFNGGRYDDDPCEWERGDSATDGGSYEREGGNGRMLSRVPASPGKYVGLAERQAAARAARNAAAAG